MNTPNDLPTPTVLHSKYRAAKQRIRELEEHNQQLLAGGQYLLKAEAEARKKADILDYLLADVTNRLPDVLRNAGYIEFHPKGGEGK
ncbi:hypothetical protein ACU4IU_12600 [Brevibacterium sp. CSND-B09]|uniref:hypothetical protein n=1 Tax=Brevibacterium sp. CSND-B09 TaxID=3462571 RepID=UPI00406A4BC0